METNEFIDALKEKFYQKGTWFKYGHPLQESVLGTIKSFLIKKNLVIISKVELDKMKAALNKHSIDSY